MLDVLDGTAENNVSEDTKGFVVFIFNVGNYFEVFWIRLEKLFQQGFLIIAGCIPAVDKTGFVIGIAFLQPLVINLSKPLFHFVSKVGTMNTRHVDETKGWDDFKCKQKQIELSEIQFMAMNPFDVAQ